MTKIVLRQEPPRYPGFYLCCRETMNVPRTQVVQIRQKGNGELEYSGGMSVIPLSKIEKTAWWSELLEFEKCV